MKKFNLVAGVAALSIGLGAPAFAQNTGQVLKGTAIGAGGGALVGAVVPGLSTGTGALIGAGTGAAVTVASHHNKRHYRDRSGRRYHINKHGRRVYD